MRNKVADLTARSMECNVTISGILEEDGESENCEQLHVVTSFFRGTMEITLMPNELIKAHRIGIKTDQERLMIAKCTPELQKCIFTNVKNLRGKQNTQNRFHFVNKQLPDILAEERREVNEQIKIIKGENEKLPLPLKGLLTCSSL